MLTINEYIEEIRIEKPLTIDDYIKKIKEKEHITKEVEHIIKYSIKNILKLNYNVIYKFTQDNNDPYYIKMEDNLGSILYIYYFIEDDKNNYVNIKTYKTIDGQKVITFIKKIEDLDNYGFVSMNIYNNKEKLNKIYCIDDFKDMIYDVRTILFLKIILNIKEVDILKIAPKYKIPLLEMFYIHYFLKNKDDTIIGNYFKIKIKCSEKYENKKSNLFIYKFKLMKLKIKKLLN